MDTRVPLFTRQREEDNLKELVLFALCESQGLSRGRQHCKQASLAAEPSQGTMMIIFISVYQM